MNASYTIPLHRGVIIPAAGRGVRFGGDVPKQYLELGGVPILVRSICTALSISRVSCVVVAVPDGDVDYVGKMMAKSGIFDDRLFMVPGGQGRQESVSICLRHPAMDNVGVILVHDAVRPLASPILWEAVAQEGEQAGAAAPGISMPDTLKRVDSRGCVVETIDRSDLMRVQTPQAFVKSVLERGYQVADASGFVGSDCASAVEFSGQIVKIVAGEETNFKITTSYDLNVATLFLS